MTARWHIERGPGVLTLARHMPARFDLAAETELPQGHPVSLAHQIRQDLWRALQRLRGFSPVVRLSEITTGWHVRAGGRVLGPIPPAAPDQVAAVLNDPKNRARWMSFANRRTR